MFETRRTDGFNWGHFLAGVAFLIAGFYVLRHPDVSLISIVLVFSIVSIVQGIAWIASYLRFKDTFNWSWLNMIGGVVDIVIGLIFLFNGGLGASTLAILFAIWFILDSLVSLIFAIRMKGFNTGMMVLIMILSVISLIAGILMLMNPVVSALTLVTLVGFYLLVFGINDIMAAFIK